MKKEGAGDGLPQGSKGSTRAWPKRGKKRKMYIIIAVVIVAFVILRLAGLVSDQGGETAVTVIHAWKGELQESIRTSGTVLGEEVQVIYAPVAGTLAEVYVAAGDAVKEGDMLIGYDMEKMERTLRQSRLQLEKSAAGYKGALADNSESKKRLAEANVNLDVLEQQITDNKAYLKELQDQLQTSQRQTRNGLAASSYELTRKLQELTPGTQEYIQVNSELSRISYLQSVADSRDYVAGLEQEIAQVQERITDYEEYKAQMESQKAASENTVMDAYDRTQYDVDKELADMTYAEAEAAYDLAKQGIVAGFDGIVTQCQANPGAPVAEGTQLLTLESSSTLKVSFRASQIDALKLATGQKADVEIAGKVYPGEVSKIDRMAVKSETNTPLVGVEIHLLETDDTIILGLDAKLTIYTNQVQDALLVPVEAVNGDKDGDFLYVAENGIVTRKPVVCGISSDIYTEVLEGITMEDEIILASYTGLTEGMPVTVVPAP